MWRPGAAEGGHITSVVGFWYNTTSRTEWELNSDGNWYHLSTEYTLRAVQEEKGISLVGSKQIHYVVVNFIQLGMFRIAGDYSIAIVNLIIGGVIYG